MMTHVLLLLWSLWFDYWLLFSSFGTLVIVSYLVIVIWSIGHSSLPRISGPSAAVDLFWTDVTHNQSPVTCLPICLLAFNHRLFKIGTENEEWSGKKSYLISDS